MVDKSTSRWGGGPGHDEAEETDPRQKMMAILVGVLALVFGVILFVLYGPKGDSPSGPPAPATHQTPTAPKVVSEWTTPDPYPEDIRDPMYYEFPGDKPGDPTPPVTGPSQPDEPDPDDTEPIVEMPTLPDFEVTAIMRSPSGNMAMVNGYLVGDGDSIGVTRVVSVGADRVTFELNGVRWVKELIQK
jgi:hypothetical protein